MSESYVEVREDGAVRLAGTLAYPEATVDDVLTVQADGSIAAAAAGGAIPDPLTTPINLQPTGTYSLTITLPAGVSPTGLLIDATDTDSGQVLQVVANGGDAAMKYDTTGFLDMTDANGDDVFIVNGAASPEIGFFGASAGQQAAPVTLGDVIAILQAFGLAAT